MLKNKFAFILLLFILWRIFLFLPLLAGSINLQAKPVEIYKEKNQKNSIYNVFLYPFANFDGRHYLEIAKDGYTKTANARFFPLFPSLILITALLFGTNWFFAGFIISNLAFLVSLFVFYKLLRLDYPDKISFWSIIFLLLFPTSFFFVSVYSESIFFLFLISAFYFVRKTEYAKTFLFGSLLTVTRIVGFAMLPSIFYELYKEQKMHLQKHLNLYILTLIIPAAFLIFMTWNYYFFADPFFFYNAQQGVVPGRSNFIFFPQTVIRYFKILTQIPLNYYEWWIALLELFSFIISVFLLFMAVRKKIRFSYIIFSLLCLFAASSSGTFNGMPRYISVLFPIFIVLALIKSDTLKVLICIISGILLFILTMFFSRGYFIA